MCGDKNPGHPARARLAGREVGDPRSVGRVYGLKPRSLAEPGSDEARTGPSPSSSARVKVQPGRERIRGVVGMLRAPNRPARAGDLTDDRPVADDSGSTRPAHHSDTRGPRRPARSARALADQLNDPGVRSHRVLTLFDGPDEVRSDYSLHGAGGVVAARGYSMHMVPKLRSALRRLDPVLVVAHGSDPLKYLVPAMIGRRRPVVYYAIGTYAGGRDRPLQLRMWRHLMARADVVAAEGHEVATP